MFPSLVSDYVPDRRMSDVEHSRQVHLIVPTSGEQFAYPDNLFVGEFRSGILLPLVMLPAKNIPGMSNILLACAIFQILNSIVCLYSVYVITFHSLWAWAYKGIHYQFMHGKGFRGWSNAISNSYNDVPVRIYKRLTYHLGPNATLRRSLISISQTLYSALIGNLKTTFITIYVSPFLFHYSLLKGASPSPVSDCLGRTAGQGLHEERKTHRTVLRPRRLQYSTESA